MPDGHLDRTLSGYGRNALVAKVRQRWRGGAVERDRQGDRLGERGTTNDRIGDECQDLLCQASLTGEPGDQGHDLVDIDAELDGSLVHGGDVSARFVNRRRGVQIAAVGEIPPGINAVRVLR